MALPPRSRAIGVLDKTQSQYVYFPLRPLGGPGLTLSFGHPFSRLQTQVKVLSSTLFMPHKVNCQPGINRKELYQCKGQ